MGQGLVFHIAPALTLPWSRRDEASFWEGVSSPSQELQEGDGDDLAQYFVTPTVKTGSKGSTSKSALSQRLSFEHLKKLSAIVKWSIS